MTRPRRHGLGLSLTLLLVVVLAATAWIGLRALAARSHLNDARLSLIFAREALLDRDVDAARAAISAAGQDTARARALTSDPVWGLAGAVPGYGATVRTARGLALAADELARDVLPQALDGVESIDPATLRGHDGAVDLEVIRAATPSVVASAEAAARIQADVGSLPTDRVVPQVARAREELLDQVADVAAALDGGATALEVAPALLGADRPRRYLMLVQQNGESRGTGGVPGGFVELLADAGRLTVASTGTRPDLNGGLKGPPAGTPQDYIDLYEAEGAFRFWVNVNLSPDLPVVAEVVEAFWQAHGGAELDGVGVLDATALSLLLAGSGPISLPGGGTLAPTEIQQFLGVEQYRGIPLTSQGALTRQDRLGDIAIVTAKRLTAGGGDTLSLLRGLSAAVQSGHLRLTSDDPVLRAGLADVDGSLPRDDAPFSYPVVYNSTGGKLDQFLDRSISYVAGPCEGDRRRSTVTVTLKNQAPEDLPEYLTIRLAGGGRTASRTNAVTLQVYGTRGADLVRATVDGQPVAPEDPAGPLLANASEAGLPMWYLGLELPPGQSRTLVLELDEPVVEGTPRVLEQPLARPLEQVLDVPACS